MASNRFYCQLKINFPAHLIRDILVFLKHLFYRNAVQIKIKIAEVLALKEMGKYIWVIFLTANVMISYIHGCSSFLGFFLTKKRFSFGCLKILSFGNGFNAIPLLIRIGCLAKFTSDNLVLSMFFFFYNRWNYTILLYKSWEFRNDS